MKIIQILGDDGSYVNGNFGFKAHNAIDNSIKLVSNGNFNFKIDSELDWNEILKVFDVVCWRL